MSLVLVTKHVIYILEELKNNKIKWCLYMINYSIGITTYSYRYEKFLINLISEIRKNKDNEIILAINGNYNENFDEVYKKNVLELSSKYNDIFPFVYPNFRSLAKMWNNIVINSTNEYVLLLNDDISITDPIFWKLVEENIEKHQTSFGINSSFCAFIIKKSELYEMGWFDERFLGIGWEDNNFYDRYQKQFNRAYLYLTNISGINIHVDIENRIINQRKSISGYEKYSEFNRKIYEQKLESIQQYPYEKFYWDNYSKL